MGTVELAKAVASEYGERVEKQVLMSIAGVKQRNIDLNETVVVAAFIVQCSQLALQLYSIKKDMGAIRSKLEDEAASIKELKTELAGAVINSTIEKLPQVDAPSTEI